MADTSKPDDAQVGGNQVADLDEFSSGRPLLEHFAVKYKPLLDKHGNYAHWMSQMVEDILTMLKEHEEAILANREVAAKIEALDKLVLGAGEYHDDPYEYVVPLRHIQQYRQDLMKFDLSQPIFKDRTALTDLVATGSSQDEPVKSATQPPNINQRNKPM